MWCAHWLPHTGETPQAWKDNCANPRHANFQPECERNGGEYKYKDGRNINPNIKGDMICVCPNKGELYNIGLVEDEIVSNFI